MSELKCWRGLIGSLLIASGIISLIQRSFDVPLDTGLARAIGYYRDMLQPIYLVLHSPLRWLGDLFEFSIPDWLQDAHTLAFFGVALFVRAQNATLVNGKKSYPTIGMQIYIVFVFGYSLLGLLMRS